MNYGLGMVKTKNPFLIKTATWLIFFVSIFFVYQSVSQNENLEVAFSAILATFFAAENYLYYFFLLLLLVFNWSLEALKWQLLIQKIEKISFLKSLESVVSGITLSVISLVGFLGLYAGRTWHLKSVKRAEVLGAVTVNSVFQSLATYLFGCLSLVYFLFHQSTISFFLSVIICVSIVLLHIVTLWILINHIQKIAFLERFIKQFYKYIQVIACYETPVLWRTYLFSFLRFVVFLFQFIIILYAYKIDFNWWEMLSGISLVFVSKSLAFNSNIFLDLGIREFSAVYFLGYFGVDELSVVCAIFTLWAINIIIPAIIGIAFTFRMKIVRK